MFHDLIGKSKTNKITRILAYDFRRKTKGVPWDGHWHSANDKGSEGVSHYFLEHSGIHKDQLYE